MNKKYEFVLNLKLNCLTFKHNLSGIFPSGEEIIFKSDEIYDLDIALEVAQGFADDIKNQLAIASGLDLSTQTEANPGDVQSESDLPWQHNEVFKIWILNEQTKEPYALAQLTEIL